MRVVSDDDLPDATARPGATAASRPGHTRELVEWGPGRAEMPGAPPFAGRIALCRHQELERCVCSLRRPDFGAMQEPLNHE